MDGRNRWKNPYNLAGAGEKVLEGYSWIALQSILLLTPKLGIVNIYQAT